MGLSHSPRIVTSGLVAYWDASNTKSYPGSGTTLSDLSGNGYNGTLTNGPTFNSSNNGTLVFDGSNDYVNFGNILNFNYTDSFTLAAWYKRTGSYSGTQNIISKQPMTSPYNGYQFGFNLNTGGSDGYFGVVAIGNYPTNALGVQTTATFNNTNWYHAVATYNGNGSNSGFSIYINSVKQQTSGFYSGTTTVSFTNSVNFEIGAREGFNQPFPGYISIAQVYNRTLTDMEVTQNYNALRGRFGI